jgi:hypothetical protein
MACNKQGLRRAHQFLSTPAAERGRCCVDDPGLGQRTQPASFVHPCRLAAWPEGSSRCLDRVQVLRRKDDGDWVVEVTLVDSGERAEYRLTRLLEDPEAD